MNSTTSNSLSVTMQSGMPPAAAVLVFKVKDPAAWELVLLTLITMAYTCICAVVCTASYRVSHTTFAFVLFFSEGVANSGCLAIYALGYMGQLVAAQAHFHPSPKGKLLLGKMVNYLCYIHYWFLFASQLHYLLIAVNRGIAICLPFQYYERWWTLRNTIATLLILWVLSFSINLSLYIFGPRLLAYYFFWLQVIVTLPSLVIYSSGLGWVLLNRYVMPALTKGQNTKLKGCRGAIARLLHSITPGSSMESVDLHTFVYCFLAFIPNCYYMVMRPAPGSLHLQLYATSRLASAGILLYIMSSLVRERMPWRRYVPARLANLSKATKAARVLPTLISPQPNQPIGVSSQANGVYRISGCRGTVAITPAKPPLLSNQKEEEHSDLPARSRDTYLDVPQSTAIARPRSSTCPSFSSKWPKVAWSEVREEKKHNDFEKK